jgi:hypothetical protein
MTSERVYRALLAVYPRAFRRDYGDAMVEAFRDLHRGATRPPLGFWLFVSADTCRAAYALHVDAWKSSEHRLALQWVGACALGAAVCGAAGSAVTWSFGYFYHPYLEGTTFVPWIFGATLGAGLGLVQAAALRGRARLPAVWVPVTAGCTALGVELAIAMANLAGPLGYGLVVGSVVAGGQWLVLRSRVRGAGWWVLPSAGALTAVALVSSAALNRTLAGMNPLRHDLAAVDGGARDAGIELLLRGLYAPMSVAEFALWLAVMATIGLVIGAITAKPVSSMLSRAR